MNPITKSILWRGTALIMVPVIFAAVLCVFWRDVPWITGIIFALGYIATAFASLAFVGYKMAHGQEIGGITVSLPFVFLILALVAIIASVESFFFRR